MHVMGPQDAARAPQETRWWSRLGHRYGDFYGAVAAQAQVKSRTRTLWRKTLSPIG